MNEDTPLNEASDAVPAESVQQAPETVVAPPSAGAQLRALREARGWTVDQVANQLNLAARQIDALEQDNYAALPGMVIVRGFIRTYAKLLQADAAPILAAIQGEGAAVSAAPSPTRSVKAASFSETQMKAEQSRGFPLKTLVAAIVVLGVGAFAVFQGQRMGAKNEVPAQAAKTDETVTPPATHETPAAAPATAKVQSAAAPAPASAVSASEQVATTVASQPAAEAKSEQAATPAPDGKNVLAINAKQESWVEVRDAKEKVVFSGLLKPGASEAVELPGPVSLVVGNAAGVDVTLRGAPVDLKGNASNVARLNLK
jgi:cytoskeleton protein RodZ